ncbi:MAG: fibrobacter succinogenes major paralogous domain-containing protein [Bacteroidales bacterium]|nr:fibrobacter succinogenes major paralogous domain-containing protein [Bacteroidales bacterium]
MKKYLLVLLFSLIILCSQNQAFSQGIAINESNTPPDPSAMLDVESTEKGMLVPRMTKVQRDAISNPATGLLIYQADEEPGFHYNAGTPASPEWRRVAGSDDIWQRTGDDVYRIDGNLGLGVEDPTQKLDVNGQIRLRGENPGPGKILTSDADGNASWQSRSGISPMSCIDIDGNVYPTVVLGTQIWMAENLRVTKYRNSESIPNITDGAAWSSLTTGAHCWYNNNQTENEIFGAIYNWYAVNDPQGLCPEGWKVPSDNDWSILTNGLGGNLVAGSKLKAVSPLWTNDNDDATNSTGLSAIPAGQRDLWSGQYYGRGFYTVWWSSGEASNGNGWLRYIDNSTGEIFRWNNTKTEGNSVRCIRE